MASNIIPDAPRAPNRQLRTITVLTFIPAMALAIPAGVVSAKPLPALGLIPMAASCFLGLVVLAGKGKRFPKGPHADFIVASSLILVLILRYQTPPGPQSIKPESLTLHNPAGSTSRPPTTGHPTKSCSEPTPPSP